MLTFVETKTCAWGHERTPENVGATGQCLTCKRREGQRRRAEPETVGRRRNSVDMSWFTISQLAAIDPSDKDWEDDAACRTEYVTPEWVDQWFPTRGGPNNGQEGVEICLSCPVRAECLVSGLYEKFGTRGGLSEKMRGRVRRELRQHREQAA